MNGWREGGSRAGTRLRERPSDRHARGGLAPKDAYKIARQIAEALEAAHDRGVVHRDLKPGNVMVSPTGVVKVLDFGLAAMVQPAPLVSGDMSNSPTLTAAGTFAGTILGTASYMSPEQAEGLPVDKRADIWSYGVVLWEMVTGKRLFEGSSVSRTLADVLRMPIDFTKLLPTTPKPIRTLLERCLDRETMTRLRDIGARRASSSTGRNSSGNCRSHPAVVFRARWTAGV